MTISLLNYINKEIHACNLDIIFNSGYNNDIEIAPLSRTTATTLNNYVAELRTTFANGLEISPFGLDYNLNDVFNLIHTLREKDPRITSSPMKLEGFSKVTTHQITHESCSGDYFLDILTRNDEAIKYNLLDYIDVKEHFAVIDPNDKVLHYINKIIHNCNVAIFIATLDKDEDRSFKVRPISEGSVMSLGYFAFVATKELNRALKFVGNTYKGYDLDQLQLFLARLNARDPRLLLAKTCTAGLANITVNEILDAKTSVDSILKVFSGVFYL